LPESGIRAQRVHFWIHIKHVEGGGILLQSPFQFVEGLVAAEPKTSRSRGIIRIDIFGQVQFFENLESLKRPAVIRQTSGLEPEQDRCYSSAVVIAQLTYTILR
jgi:hypothetical protein